MASLTIKHLTLVNNNNLFFRLFQMAEDENIIHIFMNTNEISKNKCIPLSDKDYEKIKNYGDIRITIIRNNTKASVGIP
jgi:hypothetical protein